jgi:hypothetical protein
MKKAFKMPDGEATGNGTTKSFVSLGGTFAVNSKGVKFAAGISGHDRYLKVLLWAARSETAWTPRTVE